MSRPALARHPDGRTTARKWLAFIGGSAASVAGILCVTMPTAVAEPLPAPSPTPVTATQTVPMAPLVGASETPPLAATPTLVPATSGTLRDYLSGKRVTLEPQHASGFTALSITLPMPPGWSQVPDPNVPDAFAVIANRSSTDLYTPNAQLVVYKLGGDFDPKEAITHGFVDSQSLPAWQSTDASLADFTGFPSSRIEGSYRQNDMTLNTSRRYVIANNGADRYLVSLAVTSAANRQGAPSAADATDAVVNGFRVTPSTPPTA